MTRITRILAYQIVSTVAAVTLFSSLTVQSTAHDRQRNLPFFAGTAAAYGVDRETALSMVTRINAEILGVQDRVGTLEVGKDATLFISEGDALDMRTSQVLGAFIQGRDIDLNGTQQQLYERFRDKYQNQVE